MLVINLICCKENQEFCHLDKKEKQSIALVMVFFILKYKCKRTVLLRLIRLMNNILYDFHAILE
jgi:hypothetical protein